MASVIPKTSEDFEYLGIKQEFEGNNKDCFSYSNNPDIEILIWCDYCIEINKDGKMLESFKSKSLKDIKTKLSKYDM